MNDRIVPASRWNARRTRMIGVSLVMLGGAAFLTGCADTGSLGSSGGGKPTTTTSVPATTTPVVTTPVESGSLALKTVAAPTWTDQNGPIDLSTMVVVPGDILTYHASFALEIKGTEMKAKLSTSDLGVSGGGCAGCPAEAGHRSQARWGASACRCRRNCGQYVEGRQDRRRDNTFHLRQGCRDSVVDGSVVELGAIRREPGADSCMMSVRAARAL